MSKKLEDILSSGAFGKKTRVNSKRKGSSFERKVVKLLNERFNTKEFARTPGSGAFGTTHSLPQHLIVHGDIITPQNFKYVIECKNGYGVELDDLFNEKSDMYKFIEQAARDGEKARRPWMLIYKKDRRKEIAVVENKIDCLERGVCLHGKYYLYLLKDILGLPDFYWVN